MIYSTEHAMLNSVVNRTFRLSVFLWLTIHWAQVDGLALMPSTPIKRGSNTNCPLQASEPMPWPSNTKAYGQFQQERDWAFAFSSCTADAEGSYVVNDIEGEIPECLCDGTYYRNGPAKFERNGERYKHFLDGDGFVTAFKFLKDGSVRYTGRFVETEYFLREQAADNILYRNAFGTEKESSCPFQNAFDFDLKNVANTNVLAWGGRLFALWEAGCPYELRPETLETLCSASATSSPFTELGTGMDCRTRGITIDEGGPIDEFMKVGKTFTAHPIVLDKEERMVAFTSAARANTETILLEFLEYNPNWKLRHSVKYSFSQGLAPHDFCVSDDYYCFFQNRCNLDFASYILGGKPLSHALRIFVRKPSILHLVPRRSSNGNGSDPNDDSKHPTSKPVKLSIPDYYNIHTVAEARQVNDNNQLIVYSTGWDLSDKKFFPRGQNSMSLFASFGGLYPDFVAGRLPPPTLYRTVVDLETSAVEGHQRVIDGLVMELPVADDADPNRFIYGVAYSDTADYLPPTGLCKVDIECDTVDYWWSEHRSFVGEAISVAKRNGDTGSWVLSVVSNVAKKRSSLVILDSERFSQGPVARIHLKHHLPYGLHCSFTF